MPPKKGKGSAVDPDDPSMNPEAVVDNYKKYCKLAALAPHPKVLAQLGGDEEQLEVMMKNEQLVVDGEPILGPHGTRALCTALMGNAPGMSGAVFKMAKNFRCDLRVSRCCGAFTLSMGLVSVSRCRGSFLC